MESAVPTAPPMGVETASIPTQEPEGIQPQNGVPFDDPTTPQRVESDDLSTRIEQEKEFYRQKKQMDQRTRELDEREAGLNKPRSVDDMLDDILNNKDAAEEEPEEQQMSQAEIIEEAKRQMRAEFEEEGQEYQAEEQYQGEIEEFTEDVTQMMGSMLEQYPLANEMGLAPQISEDVMTEHAALEEQYGEEYADRWYESLDWQEVIGSYENTLAENFKTMLQSSGVRKLLESYLGHENQMPSGEPPKTLSQNDLSQASPTQGLQGMTTDQRVEYAKAQLRKMRSEQ